MPVFSKDEVVSEIGAESEIGNQAIHDSFLAETSFSDFLGRAGAKKIIKVATANNRVSDRELLCLLAIAQYKFCRPDGQRYLTKFINFSSDLKNGMLFGGNTAIEALALSDSEERQNISALDRASRCRAAFILPDQRGYYYSFSVLSTIAKYLRHGFYEQFAYANAASRGFGLTANQHDFVAYSYDDFRKDYQRTSTVIHECFHVWQDMFNIKMDVGHAEVAAHLAQAVWILMQRRPLYGRLEQAAFREVAEQIVEVVETRGSALKLVTEDEYGAMRGVLKAKYPRLTDIAFKNGVRFNAQIFNE